MSVTAEKFHPPTDINRNNSADIEFDDILESQSYDESQLNTYSPTYSKTHEFAESHGRSSSHDHGGSHDYRKQNSHEESWDMRTESSYNQLNNPNGPDDYVESRDFLDSHSYTDAHGHAPSPVYTDTHGYKESRDYPRSFGKGESDRDPESESFSKSSNYNLSKTTIDPQSYEDIQSYEESPRNWISSVIYRGSSTTLGVTNTRGSSRYSDYPHLNPDLNPDEEDLAELFDEDLSDVPPYDELPSVLFLTGDVDERTMRKSLHLYQQKKRLKHIQEINERKDALHTSQQVTTFRERSYSRNKNKNISIRIQKSKDIVKNEVEHDQESNENPDILERGNSLNKSYDMVTAEYSDNSNAAKYEVNSENNDNKVSKEQVPESQMALIREKRLEKLGRLTTEYNSFRNEERFKTTLNENDNRATIMNEEKMMRKKLKIMVNKDAKLLQSDDSSGTSGGKSDRREGNIFELKDKKDVKRNETKNEQSVHNQKNVIACREQEKPDKLTADKVDLQPKTSKQNLEEKGEQKVRVVDVSDDENNIPYVMKLMKAKRKAQEDKTNRREFKQDPRYESDFDSDMDDLYDDLLFPDKEKHKRTYNKSPGKTKKNTESSNEGEENPLYIMFFTPSSQKKKTVKPKPATKNKNQTIKPISGAQRNKSADTAEIQTETRKANPVTQTGNKQEVLKLQLNDVGERRAQAFKSIKEKHYQSGVHCSSCGRSDCNSMHVQKMKEMIRAARQTGFEVVDVTPDGNCMFAAVVDQLEFYTNYAYTSRTLREAAVNWLIENPNSEDGTPYCSFLEEDWNTYLQRMLGEGQWGDHIVLRAIVQVIGHTVKVFNVGEGEGHWIMIESSRAKADVDDQPVILGQLGEFHYVSLRPSAFPENGDTYRKANKIENKTGVAEVDLHNIQLEGTESIAMFEDDYIDPASGLPMIHFSYLLRKYYPQVIIENAAQTCSVWEERANQKETSSSVFFVAGEIGNRTYFDLRYDVHPSASGCIFMSNKNTRATSHEKSSSHSSFTFVESGVHQGYAKIKLKSLYYANEFFPSSVYSEKLKKHEGKEGEYLTQGGRVYKATYLLQIPAMICDAWPGSAMSWKTRKRYENWPPKHTIESIFDSGCILKPFPHKHSQDPDNEWEIGFDLAEKALFKETVTSSQRYCYMVWKSFVLQIADLSGPLTFGHLRSVFLICCERIPIDFWNSHPGPCVIYLFDELLRCIKEKRLPNYFVPTNNMLDFFTKKELADIEEKIVTVRNQPITFIQQFQDYCQYTKMGSKLIESVNNDIRAFHNHRSLRKSTLEVFVPASTDLARDYLKTGEYELGFNMLSETFEERLSVSTCDDTLPYHLFLQNAVTGLDQNTLVWFSAYAEMQLKGQMPNPLIMDLHGDQELMKIKEVVPVEIAGEFADTLIPKTFTHNHLEFYNEFAVFLRRIGKAGAVRVLIHAHETYRNMLTRSVPTSDEDRTWEFSMMQIYSGLFIIYTEQNQDDKLTEYYPHMENLVTRLKSYNGYMWLMSIYRFMREDDRANRIEDIANNLSKDTNDAFGTLYLAKSVQSWAMKRYVSY